MILVLSNSKLENKFASMCVYLKCCIKVHDVLKLKGELFLRRKEKAIDAGTVNLLISIFFLRCVKCSWKSKLLHSEYSLSFIPFFNVILTPKEVQCTCWKSLNARAFDEKNVMQWNLLQNHQSEILSACRDKYFLRNLWRWRDTRTYKCMHTHFQAGMSSWINHRRVCVNTRRSTSALLR